MKATKWQRAVSLLLCLLMAMSFLAVNASTVYAEDGSTTTGELPQITSFNYDDGYFYNGTTKRKKTVACKIASTSINNYEKVTPGTLEGSEEPLNFLGEIVFFIDKPVKYDATTGVTTERADYPSRLLIPDEAYSITTQQGVSLDTTIVIAAEKESGADENAPTYKTASFYDLLRYTYEGTVYYYYLVIKPAASEKNTAPNIIEGLGTSSTQEFVVNEPWTIDLSKIFEDKDNDPLTYTVKEGNADAKETGALYSYTPTSDEGITLVFTASDGTDVSPEYTVILIPTVKLPQITSFNYDDGYFYNGTTKRKKTVACKIASTSINNYEKVTPGTLEGSEEPLNFLGEIVFFIDKPVKYDATTGVTTERADYPSRLLIPDEAYSITTQQGVSLDTTIVIAAEKESGADENAPTYKTASFYDLLRYTYEGTVYYYYLVIKPAASEKNTAPNIIEGLGTSSTQEFVVNEPWTIDLSKIFEDKDNDPLTYTVKEGNADAKETGALYSYTPTSDEGITLVFTASDGTDVSPEYTVILTCKVLAYHSITASSQGTYEWNTLTQDMGTVAVSVVGDDPTHVSAESTVKITATPRKYVLSDSIYNAKLSHWKVTGVNLTQEQLQSNTLTFNMPDNDVTIIAVFEKAGSVVSLTANTFAGGDVDFRINGQRNQKNSTFDSEQGVHIANVVRDTVIENARITAYLVNGQTYNSGYRLVSWQIKNVSTNTLLAESDGVTYETKPYPGQPVGGESYQAPTFKVDGKSEYSITAIFEAKDYGAVNVTVNDIKMGEATAQVDGGEASSSLTVVYEGVTVKLKATPREGFIFKSWKASYGDDDTQVTIADENAAETTFKMPQTGEKPVNVVAEFAVDPSYLSEDCALTDVTLLDNNGSSIAYYGDQDLTNFTIEVPADTDNAKLAGMILKLTVSENAQVFQDGSDTPWDANGQACNMTLGTATKFVVRSQKDLAEGYEGPKQGYTITINRAKSTKCAIESAKLGEVEGTVDQTKKTVTFTVPADTDESAVADMPLTFNCSQDASIKLKDAKENWDNGTACGMALNEEKTFVVTAEDGTTIAKYTVVIHRAPSDKKALTGATLGDIAAVINEDSHAVTFTVPADTTDSKLGEMILKFTCSPRATVKLKDADNNWPDSGEACRLKLGVPATFVVTAEDTSTLEYTVTVNREKSTEKAITEAVLTKTDGTSVKADISEQNKTITFTLPVGTTDADVAAMTLKFTCSQYASIKLEGAETNWPADGQLCGMKLNEAKTFVVTAENGGTQKYPVLIVRGKSAAKEITSAILLAKAGDTTSPATVKIDNAKKTIDFTLPAGSDTSKLGEMILKLTVSDYATVKKSGDTGNWPAEGKACGMELNKAATFTVTAENGDKQDYTVTITRAKSSENEITAAVLLNQTGDTTPFAKAQISGTNIIFTLPSDTNKTDLNSIGLKYLKLTYPESATAKMVDATGKDAYGDADGTAKWRNGDVKCNMSLNTPVKFIITAEDNTPKTYTVEIKYTAPNAPTLSDGSAARSSKTAATVKFTTNEAGTYYYKVVTHGAAAPTADEIVKSTTKGTASAGETTFTLSNLTTDARDVYIVVVSAAGGESAPLKVEIPAYDSGSDTPSTGAYKISVSTPKGGTITTNRTKADAGDEIIVTVTPDNGYQMVSGSLTYTLATKGGETKTITNNRFTMPAGDVSITCKWETATTTAKGITSFSINGVAGAVNNTTNTITITMPRGTDVTKLTPTISTNGVKSLTPGSGETVNFTTSVTYTATMEDGSTKTYTVTVYVEKGTLSDQFWDKLTDFVNQIPWWEYAKHQQSTSSYPKYW